MSQSKRKRRRRIGRGTVYQRGHRAAIIYSLVASRKLCGVDPFAYLRDVISRACDPNFTDFAQLTPIAWQAARQTSLEA